MSGNLLACFILTSGPVTLSFWRGTGVGKRSFISLWRFRQRQVTCDSFSASGQRKLLFARRHFVYSDVFIGASWKPPSCRVRCRCMNIQCGKKEERKPFQVLRECCWLSTTQFPSWFFVCHSHRTLQLCSLPFLVFVLVCRPNGRLDAIRMHVQRPLAGAGTERTGFQILRMKTRGRRRKEQRVDYKVMRRGDTTDREQ